MCREELSPQVAPAAGGGPHLVPFPSILIEVTVVVSPSTCHMDSPPPPRWSTERKALMGDGLLMPRGSLLLGGPHRLVE